MINWMDFDTTTLSERLSEVRPEDSHISLTYTAHSVYWEIFPRNSAIINLGR